MNGENQSLYEARRITEEEYCAAFKAYDEYQRLVSVNDLPCPKMLAERGRLETNMKLAWQKYEGAHDAVVAQEREEARKSTANLVEQLRGFNPALT